MVTLPRELSSVTNATLADGERIDLTIAHGVVSGTFPVGTLAGPDALDLAGFLLLPAPAEPHAHLDKALSWDLIDPPMGDLGLAIASWRAYSSVMTVEGIADRARAAALLLLRNGTTAVRSHVDLLIGDDPLRGVRALLQVREELAHLMDIELVALVGSDIPDATIEAALDLGIDTVGGAPHLAPEPLVELRRLLAVAERRGVGVDLHTDEGLAGEPTLLEFARIVRGWQQPVSAGHCVRLGTLEPAQLDEIITEVLASDIGIISLPITNLYLQGWQHPVSTPRGLTALRALLDAGVRLGAGADNVRDPFNPVGRSDALETASLLVTAGHLTLQEAWDTVSLGSRSVMSLPAPGATAGAPAEFLAIRATNLSDAVANASADRYVIHRGSIVAQSSVRYDVAAPALLSVSSLPQPQEASTVR